MEWRQMKMIQRIREGKWTKYVEVFLLVGLIFSMSMVPAFAESNPGVKFGNWVTTNVGGIFGGALAALGLFLVITRKILKGLGLMLIGGLAALLIYNGPEMSKIIADQVLVWFK